MATATPDTTTLPKLPKRLSDQLRKFESVTDPIAVVRMVGEVLDKCDGNTKLAKAVIEKTVPMAASTLNGRLTYVRTLRIVEETTGEKLTGNYSLLRQASTWLRSDKVTKTDRTKLAKAVANGDDVLVTSIVKRLSAKHGEKRNGRKPKGTTDTTDQTGPVKGVPTTVTVADLVTMPESMAAKMTPEDRKADELRQILMNVNEDVLVKAIKSLDGNRRERIAGLLGS